MPSDEDIQNAFAETEFAARVTHEGNTLLLAISEQRALAHSEISGGGTSRVNVVNGMGTFLRRRGWRERCQITLPKILNYRVGVGRFVEAPFVDLPGYSCNPMQLLLHYYVNTIS